MQPEYLGEVDQILRNPHAFKIKLAMGEDVFTTLSSMKAAGNVSDLANIAGIALPGGTALAHWLSLAAATAPARWLALIGVGSAIAPPLMLVAISVLGTGLVSYGILYSVRRIAQDCKDKRIDVVPKFLNTPLDVLALSLFDLITPLILKAAKADGEFCENEREVVFEYLTQEWGYSEDFVQASIPVILTNIQETPLRKLLAPFSFYIAKNPDCNHSEITEDLMLTFPEIVSADGQITVEEQDFLDSVDLFFKSDLTPKEKYHIKTERLKSSLARQIIRFYPRPDVR